MVARTLIEPMKYLHERARLRPGPPLLLAVAWIAFTSAIIQAHDPGLSSLDVSVRSDAITASLSMAAADVKLVAPESNADVPQRLREMARDAIRLSIDGEPLRLVGDAATPDDGGARIRLSFEIPSLRHPPRRLTIASDVPKHVARGHRELLTMDVNGRPGTGKLLDADSNWMTVDLGAAVASPYRIALRFVELGVHHILSGYDHLLFLAGLLLAAGTASELLVALTAFTIAHTVSLALVVAGGFHAPPALVEPLIAASIVWIGVENLTRRHRMRWLVVFGFGLIHGFGFADALLELGFGSSAADVALALFSFNAGVEAGQLAAAAAMLPLVWMLTSRPVWQSKLLPLCSSLIAVAGGYWLIERLLA
jgi:HupE/UreJ protein